MKNHLKWAFAFFVTIFISCEQENLQLETNKNIAQQKQIEPINEKTNFDINEFSDCFDDMSAMTNKPTFAKQFGELANVIINYKSEKGESTIYPLIKNNSIETLLMVKGINDGHFINRTSSLSANEISGTMISAGIVNLFKLTPNDLNSLENSKLVTSKLGNNFIVLANGNLLEIEEKVRFEPNKEAANKSSVSSLCDYSTIASLYFTMFGLPEDAFDSQIMVDAILSIVPNNEYCYCPQTCLMQNYLLVNRDISDSVRELLKQNYFLQNYNVDFGILNQITMNGSVLSYNAFNSFCNSTIECEGCSAGERSEVIVAHTNARDALQCTIDLLESYDGNSPSTVKNALMTHFDNDSKFLATFLSNIFSYVRLFSSGTNYQLQFEGEGFCYPNSTAWSIPSWGLTDVRLCHPKYWSQTSAAQSNTLIHEWMHLYFFSNDIAYAHDPAYPNLTTTWALWNADSFAFFVSDLCLL